MVGDEDIKVLLDNKNAQNTNKATKYTNEYIGQDEQPYTISVSKMRGLVKVEHKECIKDAHEKLLITYFTENLKTPVSLQQYVWYIIMKYTWRRGREGLRDLMKNSFSVKEFDGKKYNLIQLKTNMK